MPLNQLESIQIMKKTYILFIFIFIITGLLMGFYWFIRYSHKNEFSEAMVISSYGLDENIKTNTQLLKWNEENMIWHLEERARAREALQPVLNQIEELMVEVKNARLYIEKLRTRFIEAAGGTYTEDEANQLGHSIYIEKPKSPTNKSIVEAVFMTSNKQEISEGMLLKQEIENLRNRLMSAAESLWDNGGIKGTVFADPSKKNPIIKELKKDFELAFPVLFNSKDNNDWVETMFFNKPVAAVYPLLRQLENQTQLMANTYVNFIAAKVSYMGCNYQSSFEAFVNTKRDVVKLGENYEAEIFLGILDYEHRYMVSVDGKKISKYWDGPAIYSKKATKLGKQTYNARFEVMNPLTGETEVMVQTFSYEVVK